MRDQETTYWMMPRSVINGNPHDFSEQRALIAYNILFNGPLVISDSDVVVNPQLRNAILNQDSFVKELIDHHYLQFAFRVNGEQVISLAQTARNIKKNKGHNPLIADDRHGPSPEFDYIESLGRRFTYSSARAAERYTRESLKLFRSLSIQNRYSEMLPVRHALALTQVLESHVEEGNLLNWSSFLADSGLWVQFGKRFPDLALNPELISFSHAVARGPYASFIPEALGVNPAYSPEDSLGMDVWRKRFLLAEELLEKKTIRCADISVIDYVSGISALSFKELDARIPDRDQLWLKSLECDQGINNVINAYQKGKLMVHHICYYMYYIVIHAYACNYTDNLKKHVDCKFNDANY